VRIEVFENENDVAEAAALRMAEIARAAAAERGRAVIALSGGHTPWRMLSALAGLAMPWERVHIVQVDERVAPAGDPERNLTHLRQSLLDRVALPADHVHPMPVESPDLDDGVRRYATMLEELAGTPPVLDLVHLGLGADGHTASLVPGDPVLEVDSGNVAVAGPYQGRRRMTLTYPVLDRARHILWVVTGADKARMLECLRRQDHRIPAGRVSQVRAEALVDRAAADRP
jgi:6-phosphogluconolactonase